MFRFFVSVLLFTSLAYSKEYPLADDSVIFPGHISKINPVAKLIRIKIKFENAKFLSKNNRVEFWSESFPQNRCLTYVEGRTSDYLLLRVPEYKKCLNSVYFSTGSYVHMYSPDLENSLNTARELVGILKRKYTALNARKTRSQAEVDGFIEKVDIVNKRYEILRQKLELEWQKEISALEEDKTRAYQSFKQSQARLNDLEYKMRQYRVRDQNMTEDRWSLDPNLYYRK